jgi:hypothetical protein
MKVYVAASFPRKPEARALAELLAREGYYITSNWVFAKDEGYYEPKDHEMCFRAKRDYNDVVAADVIVSITGDKQTMGGRHTEVGIGLQRRKHVILYGSRENVFHWLPQIAVVTSYNELLLHLKHLWPVTEEYARGGLDHRYAVHHQSGLPVDGPCFVMRPDIDPHARKALAFYANCVREENKQLAIELGQWIGDLT